MKFTNKGNKTGEILIYEDIGGGFFGGIDAKEFSNQLSGLGDVDTIEVRINSYGGEVFQGFAMYNALNRHPARKIVHIDGVAASIASVIALAGDEIYMADNAFYMIHEPMAFAGGSAKELRAQADLLDKIRDQLLAVYLDRSVLSAIRLDDYIAQEKWFDATEAKNAGFVDEITATMDLAAHYNPKHKFRHMPEAIQSRAKPATIEPKHNGSARAAMVYMQNSVKK